MMNRRLKQQKLQWFCALESQVIEIRKTFQLWSDIKIRAGVRKKNSRVHEIGLALFFAGTQGRNQASRRREQHARAQQSNPFSIPEAEKSARKIRQVHDVIKTARAPIPWIRVA